MNVLPIPSRIVLLIGIAGSGKGTQAEKLAQERGWHWIEMGTLIRKRASVDDEKGRELRALINKGHHLAPQEPMKIFEEEVAPNCRDGATLLLDGFPRTATQDRLLWDFCYRMQWPTPQLAIYLDVPGEQVLTRLLERAKKNKEISSANKDTSISQKILREDDYENAIRERIEYFKIHAPSMIDWYRYQNRLLTIDGTKSPEEVARVIAEGIDSFSW